jgi:antitoxin CptB
LALEKTVTGTRISSEGLDERRRRLLFRSWHRGIREMDFVLGRFADAHLTTLSEAELDDFERLIGQPDPLLYSWVSGERPVPPDYDTAMFRRVRDFQGSGGSR